MSKIGLIRPILVDIKHGRPQKFSKEGCAGAHDIKLLTSIGHVNDLINKQAAEFVAYRLHHIVNPSHH